MIVSLLTLAVLGPAPQAYPLGPFDPRIPAALESVPWRVDPRQSLMFAWTEGELRLAGVDTKLVEDEARERVVDRIDWVRDFPKDGPPPKPPEGVPPLDAALVRRIEVAVAFERAVAPLALAVLVSADGGPSDWHVVVRSYRGGDVSGGIGSLSFGRDHSIRRTRRSSLSLRGLDRLPLPKGVLPFGSIPDKRL